MFRRSEVGRNVRSSSLKTERGMFNEEEQRLVAD
jgi:hypothetical protein